MVKKLSWLFLVAVSLSAFAGTPYEVVDLYTKPIPASSAPDFVVAFNGRILFRATTPQAGQELFVTDGTAAGTKLLKDINPGPTDSAPLLNVVVMPNAVYFTALDQSGPAVWKTDGTAEGTVKATEVAGTQLILLGALGSKLFYLAQQSRELWATDGTAASTVKVATLTRITPYATFATRLGNAFYVGTEQGVLKTDGTPAGTQTILGGVRVGTMVAAGNRLFFAGMQSGTGSELWSSDGTASGTQIVADLTPGSGSTLTAGTNPMAALGTRVIFRTVKNECWSSDGTSAGTLKLADAPDFRLHDNAIAVSGGFAWFAASDANGTELWRSDGSAAGTSRVTDINPGAGSSDPFEMTPFGSRILFYADDGEHGFEPWITDGTTATLVRDINPGSASSVQAAPPPLVVGNRAYFGAYEPQHGAEAWTSDGTAAGTQLLANLSADKPGSSSPYGLIAGASRLYFNADGDNDPHSMWTTDGTAAGTKVVIGKPFGQGLTIGDTLYYVSGKELWKSDGTAAGTVRLKNFDQHVNTPGIDALYNVGGRLYVLANDGTPTKLWTLDDSGTGLFALSPAGNLVDGVQSPTFVAGRPYFLHPYGDVLTIDPGALLPRRIYLAHDSIGNKLSFDSGMLNSGGLLYFFVYDGVARKTSLWTSDGTPEGTKAVKELPDNSNRQMIAAPDGSILFTQTDPDHGYELWRSDGTPNGTALLKDLNPGPSGSAISFLATLGEKTIFALGAGTATLWVTDGTAGGTVPLSADVQIQAPSPTNLDNFTIADGIFYFRGTDTAHGDEIWQTDGTPSGTRLAADLWPGTGTSYPRGFARAGNLLYVSANSESDGVELWAMPLDTPPAFTIDDLRVDESAGTATLHVRLTHATTQRLTVDYETLDHSAKAGSDYTSRNGTLTFEAGETDKTIAIGILNDATPESPKSFLLHLRNGSAPIERAYAAVIIDDDDRNADVELALKSDDGTYAIVRNNGPSSATGVTVCIPSSGLSCAQPFELLAGEERKAPTSAAFTKVSAFERDPNSANNTLSFIGGSTSRSLTVTPALPQAGTQASLIVASDKIEEVALVSSDPTVLSVPAKVTTPATVAITALKPGFATVSTTIFGQPTSVTVQVVAAGDHRYPTSVQFDTGDQNAFGAKLILSGRLFEATLDGVQPTGTMTFTIDSQTFVNPVSKGFAAIPYTMPKPGRHKFGVVYSGDANFFGSSVSYDYITGPANATFSATATPAGATIVVHGVPGTPPTGTLTVTDLTKTVATNAPLVPLTDNVATVDLTNLTPGARSLYIQYSGDNSYWSTTVTIPIVHSRQHAAPH